MRWFLLTTGMFFNDAGASCFALRRDTRSLCTFSLKVGLELVSLGALPR